MRKILTILMIILATFLLVACSGTETTDAAESQAEEPAQEDNELPPQFPVEEQETAPVEETKKSATKQISMKAKQWEFIPSEIKVQEGDTVKLSIESVDVTHGIRLSEFGVSETLTPGKTTEVEFVADKKGTFTFFCSVQCGSGHGGMKGKLVVE